MNIANDIINVCNKYNITITQRQAAVLNKFADLLLQYNCKVNLTAITQPQEMISKHFLDSLLLSLCVDLTKNQFKLLDIGCGAGFPSIPLYVVYSNLQVTQMESVRKKTDFLRYISKQLSFSLEVVNQRAEDAAKSEKFREVYDIVVARAVAPLNKLAEYCLPFVKKKGVFVAMKGSKAEEEILQAQSGIHVLGGKIESIKEYQLPDKSIRKLVLIKKISQTSTKYPRCSAKIAKNPL